MPGHRPIVSLALGLLAAAAACSQSPAAPTVPQRQQVPTQTSPPPSPAPTFDTVNVTGVVSSFDTSMPIGGAQVYPGAGAATIADAAGHYAATADLGHGSLATGYNINWAIAEGYDQTAFYLRSTTQDFHLHPIQHLTLGTPFSIEVSPSDSLCLNNMQDPTFGEHDFVCRRLHLTASSAGTLTIDGVSVSGPRSRIEVETPRLSCCQDRFQNPNVISVSAGTDVTIDVEMPSTSTVSQTFVVTASMSGSPVALAKWNVEQALRYPHGARGMRGGTR